MKSQIAKVIAGFAITTTLGVTAFSVASIANAKSVKPTEPINLVASVKKNNGDKSGGEYGRPDLSKVATLFGISAADLKTELQSGKSLATIAATKNVAVSLVVSTIVADIKSHLDAEVVAGEYTQAEADAKLVSATARVTEMVNKVRPAGDQRGPGRGDHGRGDDSNA